MSVPMMPAGGFSLPRYNEIPGVGLYLKQVVKLINEALEPLVHSEVTETMLSNYVKKHLVSSPVKKQYDREQIARLIFIVLAKNAVSLDNITVLLNMQAEKYSAGQAYDYFCAGLENALKSVYGGGELIVSRSDGEAVEKTLLHNIIVTVANKCFLDDCFMQLGSEA